MCAAHSLLPSHDQGHIRNKPLQLVGRILSWTAVNSILQTEVGQPLNHPIPVCFVFSMCFKHSLRGPQFKYMSMSEFYNGSHKIVTRTLHKDQCWHRRSY